MGISIAGSWLGALFGAPCLVLFAPLIGEHALKFQSYEMFWVTMFGIVIAARCPAAIR
jgi:putative tricarboxylic transport membrane protein